MVDVKAISLTTVNESNGLPHQLPRGRIIQSGDRVSQTRKDSNSWSTPILSGTIPLRSSATCNSAKSVGSKRVGLSRSEQLVELIRWRLTNKEIASRPNLSEHTVRNTFTAFYAKQGHPIELRSWNTATGQMALPSPTHPLHYEALPSAEAAETR